MRKESEAAWVPSKTLKNDQDKTDQERDLEKFDITRYFSLRNAGVLQLMDIIKTSVDERSQSEQFFLQMYLQTQVVFFQIYDRNTVKTLVRCMQLHYFTKDKVIYSEGDEGD